MKIKVTAIVPCAGVGKRFNTSVRKTFVELGGVPLLIHALRRLQGVESITEIIPVFRKEDMGKGLEIIESYNLNKIEKIAPGGKERQDSIYNAIRLIKEENLILVHDGVRPFVTLELIERLLKEVNGLDGVVPGTPVKETIKEVGKNGFVVSTMKRERLLAIQTPQVFPFQVIKTAYDKAYAQGSYATDDATLVERIGGKIKVIMGDPLNIKVTTPEDLDIAELILKGRGEGRRSL